MKGKISQWHDKKGFGFIVEQNDNERIFFHISSVVTRERRPEIGDIVDFNVIQDKDNRLKADDVVIEGLSKGRLDKVIDDVKSEYNTFNYLLILVVLGSLGYSGVEFYEIGAIGEIWPYAIPAIIAFLLLNRKKILRWQYYACAKCQAVVRFNNRTRAARNRGITKLFCNKCYSSSRNEV